MIDLDFRYLTTPEDDIFFQWFTLPGILDANRQCAGSELRYQGANSHIKVPLSGRQTRADELYDPNTFSWHRGVRPKWGTVRDDRDPRLINSLFLNNITYLTPVSPRNGGTIILDGSHRLEGRYPTLEGALDRRADRAWRVACCCLPRR